MARKPATAAEIVEALQSNPWIQMGNAMPYTMAVRWLRVELHTTSQFASRWLSQATNTVPHDFELIGTVGGRVTHVSRGEDAILLNEAGYASLTDTTYWPYLSTSGELVRESSDSEDFVVLSKDLQAMCQRSAKHRANGLAALQRSQQLSIDGAEERYGASLIYFRGLLELAGIGIDTALDARYLHSVLGDRTTLTLVLKDGEIDAVANVLAAHDIEPFPPSGAVTLKPGTTDRAPEELDSV